MQRLNPIPHPFVLKAFGSIGQISKFPSNEVDAHIFITRQIELDNFHEIEDPYQPTKKDLRVYKINKRPVMAEPDAKLRK